MLLGRNFQFELEFVQTEKNIVQAIDVLCFNLLISRSAVENCQVLDIPCFCIHPILFRNEIINVHSIVDPVNIICVNQTILVHVAGNNPRQQRT